MKVLVYLESASVPADLFFRLKIWLLKTFSFYFPYPLFMLIKFTVSSVEVLLNFFE